MSDTNKVIVQKVKELLASRGYEVQTSHLYHVFSELAGYENWQTAKAKNAEFKDILQVDSQKFPVISRDAVVAELEKHLQNLSPQSSALSPMEPLMIIGVAEKFGLLSREESLEWQNKLEGRREIRVKIIGGKYKGKYGSIHFLDRNDWIQGSSKSFRVKTTGFFGDRYKISHQYLKEISEEEYQTLDELGDLDALAYGPVKIIKGKLKGKIGLYDDDEGKNAIVYIEKENGYYEIPHSYLEQHVSDSKEHAEIFKNTLGNSVTRIAEE